MKVLIFGGGSHTKRRIIPALLKIKLINDIYLVSERNSNQSDLNKVKLFKYSEFINIENKFDLILISNFPSKHIEIFENVRNFGSKFIIEKPITNKLQQFLNNDFDLIFQEKLVYESNAFMHHPLYQEVKKILNKTEVLKIVSTFTIPQLDTNNFRYKKELGGSSVLDQGVYPISLMLDLFKQDIEIKDFKISTNKKLNIDTEGYLIAITAGGVEIELSWGINKEYKNELKIYNNKSEFYFPFIFSKPENHISNYFKKNEKSNKQFTIGNFDQFQIMYEKVLSETDTNSLFEINKLKYKYSLIKDMLDNKTT